MPGMQLLKNHGPHFGLRLFAALGIVFGGSVSAQPANAAVGAHQLERGAADSIREKVTQNWNVVPGLPGMKDVLVQIRLRLDRSGRIVGEPHVTTRGCPEETQSFMAASAVRAVARAAPFRNLPRAQFDNETNSVEVILNFESGDMAL